MKATAIGFALVLACASGAVSAERGGAIPAQYAAMVARHAQANGVPEALVHRVIMRESRYNPKARNGPYWGMMQMSVATARGAGFRGSPSELLDAETNLRFGVRYLAGAYKTARGDHGRAVGFYARGYYYDAKRQGLLASIGMGRDGKFSSPPPAVAVAPAASAGFEMASVPAAAPAGGTGIAPKAAAPVLASVVPAARPVPMPPVRGAGPTPAVAQVAAAATGPSPTARVIDPKTAAPALASVAPVPRPRDTQVVTGSVAPRAAPSPRSGATTPQVAAVPAPVAGPSIPLPKARDEVADVTGKVAPGRSAPQPALAYAAQSGTDGAAPIPAPRGPVPPMPPRR